MRLKPLDEQVVVVFGASSGIGRETALRFGRKGASVVIAARDREGLESLAEEIRQEGGRATVVQAEAADFDQVKGVADAAVNAYGRLDTWVHVAAVTQYARFDETTPEEFRRIVDVNLMGATYGAMAALPHLKAEGRGALILISSVEGKYALPLQSAYSASKHGLEGFAKALRLELQRDGLPISVTTILPSSTNTPLFDVARTKMGVKPKGFPPIYQPHLVADAIVWAATHPEREIVVGGAGKALAVLNRISPRLADAAVARKAFWLQRTTEERSPEAPGNLYEPVPGHFRVEGSYSGRARPFSIYTWLRLHRGVRYGLGGLLLGGLAFAVIGPATILTGTRTMATAALAAMPFRRRRVRKSPVQRVSDVAGRAWHTASATIPGSFAGLASRVPLGGLSRRRRSQSPMERLGEAVGRLGITLRPLLPASLVGLLPWAATGWLVGRRRPQGRTAEEGLQMPSSPARMRGGSPAQRETGPRMTREQLSWSDPEGTTEEPPIPSQAEGARRTVEEDLCEKGLAPPEECEALPPEEGPDGLVTGRRLPSQAEGERDTVEEDLGER